MERGTVKWFEAEKGYGFITCDSGSTEYFVHQSNLDDLGSLDKGQRVEFELGEGRKGPQAVNVRLIDNVEA